MQVFFAVRDLNVHATPGYPFAVPVIVALLLSLEVVEQDRALLGLFTPITDHDARAVDDLASIAITINLAYLKHQQIFISHINHQTYTIQPTRLTACHLAP